MSILRDLTNFLARRGGLKALILENWKPKLVCLVLATLVWLWLEHYHVRQSDDWDQQDGVRLSLPELNF